MTVKGKINVKREIQGKQLLAFGSSEGKIREIATLLYLYIFRILIVLGARNYYE